MRTILWNHILHLLRQPFAVLGMIVLTVVFAVATGQVNRTSTLEVPVFTENLSADETNALLEELNKEESMVFQLEDQKQLEEKIEQNAIDMALQLGEGEYTIYTDAESADISIVEAHVRNVLQEEAVLKETSLVFDKSVEELKELVASNSDLYAVTTKSFQEDDFIYDSSLHALFGFSLFFVVFTVSFTVSSILQQKQNGMWNRLILSPLSKSQIYLGHLSFSFLLGYAQLALIYSFFEFVIGVDLYGGYPFVLIAVIPYLFALVSLGVLISGLVTNPRQLDAIIPLIAVSMAMIGGAYWPLEIVQSEILITLSKLVPIKYGMDMLKGATIMDWSLGQFFLPASVLFCMGVLFMGIGLNLMERRAS
jgi:ABC-2 type transport system permease protein